MAFFDELRQRKVVRVAAAYLVVAWLGVQVASVALPAFEAPGWVLRVLILVLALGFPLALVLAWAVDLTEAGPRFSPGGAGWKRMLAISAALGVLAVGWFVYGQPAWKRGTPLEPVATTPAAAAARSIAVLPFVNMSGDPANDYFSDGLAETTLDMLAKVRDLKVIARTSSFAFKGKARDVREIGRALDAATLLEGSVQQAGQTVRITAQLIRTSDGVHLWSNQYDRQLTDVFKIQDEIAGEVVKALQLALAPADRQRLAGGRTGNIAAYRAYLRGNALLRNRHVPEMRAALGQFEQAMALDPNYALSLASAGMTLTLLQNYGAQLSPGELARRDRYIARALALEPGLGEAYLARGAVRERANDLQGAEEDYRRATELAPNNATGFQWYGELLKNQLGDALHARPLIEHALQLDPLSPVIGNEHVMLLAGTGEYAGALAANARLIKDHPDYTGNYQTRARLLELAGDLPGSLRSWNALRQADADAFSLQAGRCDTLLHFGALAEAEACARDIEQRAGSQQLTLNLRSALRLIAGDRAGARALLDQRKPLEPWDEVGFLLDSGEGAKALPILQGLDAGLFLQPTPRLTSSYPVDAVWAGAALLAAGADAQGRDLLRRAIADNARHPIVQAQFGRGWNDVIAWTQLGDTTRACASVREAVAAGLFTGIEILDTSALAQPLVKAPCYAAAIAPARARRAAQVAAARAAGLL